jgi:hypothetical protein
MKTFYMENEIDQPTSKVSDRKAFDKLQTLASNPLPK